jgi:exodeoxyribonuclease VII large subunit
MESGFDRQDPELARDCLTVSQLNRAVSGVLHSEFGTLRVRGELASLSRAASGHWYFTLKDASAQLRCVMFRSRNALVGFAPRDGDEVEVVGAVGIYEARGDFQLTVEAMRRFGAGRLWEEFLRLRQRLSAEGLFDAERKRPLPALPRSVGVITSLQAAALRDVLATLRRRAPYLGVVVYPVPVQGAEAAGRIAAMLATASRRAEVDVLLLVRGGGSLEDLWSFNAEEVARAIRASALPVIVGVGHESDFTIADFAADLRAPTPTAAAELVAPEREALLRELAGRVRSISRALGRGMGERAQRLDYALRLLASPRAPLRALDTRVVDLRARCAAAARLRLRLGQSASDGLAQRLERARTDPAAGRRQVAELIHRLQQAQQRGAQQRSGALALRASALSHLNVQGVLDRGFAIVRDAAGRALSSADRLAVGMPVTATLARGSADLNVTAVHPPAADPPGAAGEA